MLSKTQIVVSELNRQKRVCCGMNGGNQSFTKTTIENLCLTPFLDVHEFYTNLQAENRQKLLLRRVGLNLVQRLNLHQGEIGSPISSKES